MTKKILALVLALVMVFGAVPFFAFADEDETVVTAADTVAAWDENLAPVLAELFDNEASANWKYVAENDETLRKTMITYTAFALYDDAWKNGFDKSVSVEDAEKILVALIEKVDANVGESKFNEIIAVLQTASDLNDLLQKVNSYVEISDVLTSDEWTKTFKYINYAIKAGKLYEDARDEVIEAYARILSVQAANEMYKDLLEYTAGTCSYDVVCKACNNLINDIETSVDELIKGEIKGQLGFKSSEVLNIAARIAMETNSYTAVALKVYDIGTSVADALWNTSDQYVLMDELYTTFFLETCAAGWANLARQQGDAEKFVFGTGALLGLRQAGAQTLYDLKVAQNKGIVGKVKNQINLNVAVDEVNEMAFLANAEEVIFNTDIADLKPVTSILTVNSNAVVDIGGYRLYNTPATIAADNGYFYIMYSPATGNYVKSCFVTEDADVQIKASSDTLVTLINKKLEGGVLADYSLTDITVGENAVIALNTAGTTYTYTVGEEAAEIDLNTTFVYPELNAVTFKSVANAAGAVVKEEATNKVEEIQGKVITIDALIRDIFDKIITAIKNLFKIAD